MKKISDPLVLNIIQAMENTKAFDPIVLDIRHLSSIAEYVLIASGTNPRQIDALFENITREVKAKQGRKPLGVEGKNQSLWTLIDYGDVIVHLFIQEMREFYQLEDLWLDAKKLYP